MQSEDGRFSWQRMGRPDYAICAGLVYSLPPEIRSKLSAPALEVLCRITFLCWSFSARSGRGRAYCVPSERWLGQQVQRSERSVRRYLALLSRYGLLSWTRRLGPGKTWTSNLYQLGKTFLACVYAKASKKVQQIHQRPFLADKDLKKELEDATPNGASSKSTSLPNDTPAPPSASPPLREEADAAPRKSLKELVAELTAAGRMKPQVQKKEVEPPCANRRALLKAQLLQIPEEDR